MLIPFKQHQLQLRFAGDQYDTIYIWMIGSSQHLIMFSWWIAITHFTQPGVKKKLKVEFFFAKEEPQWQILELKCWHSDQMGTMPTTRPSQLLNENVKGTYLSTSFPWKRYKWQLKYSCEWEYKLVWQQPMAGTEKKRVFLGQFSSSYVHVSHLSIGGRIGGGEGSWNLQFW